jgi:hypothetical protein
MRLRFVIVLFTDEPSAALEIVRPYDYDVKYLSEIGLEQE